MWKAWRDGGPEVVIERASLILWGTDPSITLDTEHDDSVKGIVKNLTESRQSLQKRLLTCMRGARMTFLIRMISFDSFGSRCKLLDFE